MGELILAALGNTGSEDEDQNAYEIAGAMELASGLLELTRIRKMIAKALKG